MSLMTMIIKMSEGLSKTCAIFFLTLLFSLPLGMIVALLRMSKVKIVSAVTRFIITILRGTPLMIQLFLIYFGLPALGINLEAFTAGIIGIGINVAHTREDFAGELENIATSLELEVGAPVARAALAAAMIEELDALYQALLRHKMQPYLDTYRRDCLTIGQQVQLLWEDVHEKVLATGVDADLGLEVLRQNGAKDVIRTGEVSVRGLYGYVE